MSLLVKRTGLENTKKKMSHMVGKQEGKSGIGWLPQSQANFLTRWLETSSIE